MSRGTWGGSGDIHPLAVRIQFLLGTSQCQTGFHLRDQSLTPADVQDAADDVAQFVTTNFRTIFSNEDRFIGVDVVDMTTGEGGAVSFGNTFGTIAWQNTVRTPSFLTVPISLKGEIRRRYGRGGMLWPMRSESWETDNVLNAEGIAGFQGVIDAMTARYLANGTYRMINVHGVIPAKPATPTTPARAEVPPSWYDVTTIRMNTVLSFLRSRKQGQGS